VFAVQNYGMLLGQFAAEFGSRPYQEHVAAQRRDRDWTADRSRRGHPDICRNVEHIECIAGRKEHCVRPTRPYRRDLVEIGRGVIAPRLDRGVYGNGPAAESAAEARAEQASTRNDGPTVSGVSKGRAAQRERLESRTRRATIGEHPLPLSHGVPPRQRRATVATIGHDQATSDSARPFGENSEPNSRHLSEVVVVEPGRATIATCR
jgi:hypothetical protein